MATDRPRGNSKRNHRLSHPLVVILLAIFMVVNAHAGGPPPSQKTISYTVVKIIDGDTFLATDGHVQFKVRIAGIDAPETGQPYAKVATHQLAKAIQENKVTLLPLATPLDRYNRVLAHVFVHRKNIGLDLIRQGMAFYYRPTCQDHPEANARYNYDPTLYIDAERSARFRKVQLWTHKPQLPCEFRRSKK